MTAMPNLATMTALQVFDGVAARVVHGEQASLAVVELEPGAVVPEHRHGNDQLGVLLRGSVTYRIGEEERVLEPGAVWSILGDVPHRVTAGPEGAILVEAFAPPRFDWNELPQAEHAPLTWPETH